jgi:hypothetical protein
VAEAEAAAVAAAHAAMEGFMAAFNARDAEAIRQRRKIAPKLPQSCRTL